MSEAEPLFSVVTPVYNPPAAVLEAMLRSVREQTFGNWEHCLVDDASTEPHVRQRLMQAAREDSRVRVEFRDENGGIVAASNDGLGMARGEFVVLLDHDDELVPEALAEVDKALRDEPTADYVYTDEVRIDEDGNSLGEFIKPAWSPEHFRTQMYVLHLSVLRRSLVTEVGGFHQAFNGSQDWDLILRVTERARKVVNIPQVLYRWRAVTGSTALEGVDAKPWAFEAGTRALQAHCDRIGFPARVRHNDESPGIYHLDPALTSQPLVSIVIPTAATARDVWAENTVLAEHCIKSIVTQSTYQNYEIIVVVDERIERRHLDVLGRIAGDRLRVVWGELPFNFADRINHGALAARGEHLLLLNDDMEVITPNWMERLLMYSSHPGIGAVGAKLCFGDGRLQHVGVVVRGGSPGHLARGFRGDYVGYFAHTLVAQNFLAVTGACIMCPRDVFETVGGFSTEFPLNFNDVDFCLKLWAEGYRVAWDPDTRLYHFESSSRDCSVADSELALFRRRWGSVHEDPFYRDPMLLPVDDDPARRRAVVA